jgi:hypothetical protein
MSQEFIITGAAGGDSESRSPCQDNGMQLATLFAVVPRLVSQLADQPISRLR